MKDRFVNVAYFRKELESLISTLSARTPDELGRYLRRLADIVSDDWQEYPSVKPLTGISVLVRTQGNTYTITERYDEDHPCYDGEGSGEWSCNLVVTHWRYITPPSAIGYKPCPFCGETLNIREIMQDDFEGEGTGSIMCFSCGSSSSIWDKRGTTKITIY